VLHSLDAAAVRHWCTTGLDALRRHQREIDDLNVYPVPDGDTGTNLVLTVSAASEALAAGQPAERPTGQPAADGVGAALARFARGALLGARGNSGVILSQLLRGLADGLAALPAADGRAFAAALERAADAAYEAVAAPVEGTVLTVARAAARAALASDSGDLAEVVAAASLAARVALDRTPDQLPALARAGVVDAGGRGLVVLLDALVEVVTGQRPPDRPPARRAVRAVAHTAEREAGSDEYGYEVQYLLDAAEPAVAALRARLAQLGDSLVVVGAGDGPWNVHVHVNDVGAAIEAGVEAGRPYRISVVRFADQTAAGQTAAGQTVPGQTVPGAVGDGGHATAAGGAGAHAWAGADVEPVPGDRAVVVVGHGDGLARLFAGEGAAVVACSGTAPSTAEILAAVRGTGAGRVVILPNDPNVHAVADAAAAEARGDGIRAGVVPTRSPVQALAALAVRDATRRFEDDVIAMAEAVGACRYAEVTTASREALTVAGRCRAGDVLALVDGEVNLSGADLLETCRRLLDRLLAGGGELVTLLSGEDAPADLCELLVGHVGQAWPFVEVQCYEGGQPHYPLLVGVE
jgi:hypothetical protein